jgi:hypothetical protein
LQSEQVLPKQIPEHAMFASLTHLSQELPVQLALHLFISLDLQPSQLQYWLHFAVTETSHFWPQLLQSHFAAGAGVVAGTGFGPGDGELAAMEGSTSTASMAATAAAFRARVAEPEAILQWYVKMD